MKLRMNWLTAMQALSPIASDGGEGWVRGRRETLRQRRSSATRYPLTPALSPDESEEREFLGRR